MKLMKHITIALVLCAVPAMAFGQVDVECTTCTHVVPVLTDGDGGFIAEADGVTMVDYLATCDGVYRSGQLMANSDGIVGMALQDEGLVCTADDAALELGPIMDGGWFWINTGTTTATGSLVDMDVLDNAMTQPTMSDHVTMTQGKGATLVMGDGRAGILSTILPVAEMDPTPVTRCMGATRTSCMLGDGGTQIAVMGPPSLVTGMRSPILNNTVSRPAVGTITVTFDLWGNGTGHYTTAFTTATANLGQPGGAPLSGTLEAELGTTAPGGTATAVTSGSTPASGTTAGLSFEATISGGANTATLYIVNDTDYCGGANNHNATVVLQADLTDAQAAEVTPTIALTKAAPTDTNGIAATRTITVVCPAASSQQGVELVPENPFPIE